MHKTRMFGERTGADATGAIRGETEIPIFAAGFVVEVPREMTLTARDAVASPSALAR